MEGYIMTLQTAFLSFSHFSFSIFSSLSLFLSLCFLCSLLCFPVPTFSSRTFLKPNHFKFLNYQNPMKEIIQWTSSSEEERLKSVGEQKQEEQVDDDLMTIEEFPQSRKRNSSTPTTPNSNPMVAANSDEGVTSYSQKQVLADPDKAKSCAMERAKEVQAKLDPTFPSFVRSMLPSHISGGFWLRLSPQFCYAYLPKTDTLMSLVDEDQQEYQVKYLVQKNAFSGGWRGFSLAHNLVEGDALVFHLVKATKFQVYIIRAYSMAELDGVLGLLSLRGPQKQIDSCRRTKTSGNPAKKRQKTLSLNAVLKPGDKRGNGSEKDVGSEILEGVRFSETNIEFKNVENLKSFTISVNGLIIDSELSEEARTKYYELCSSQKTFLHEYLLKGINCKLAAGVISQTINIADSLRVCKLSTSRDDFAEWDKSLGAFEQLGMNVGFLRARIQKLVSLAYELEEGEDAKRHGEAIVGRSHVQEEIRSVEAKLVELKETCKRLDAEIEALEAKSEVQKLKFQSMADAPW